MSRAVMDMAALLQPGDTFYVSILDADGVPTGMGHKAKMDPHGNYAGKKMVAAGRARVDAIKRPGRAR